MDPLGGLRDINSLGEGPGRPLRDHEEDMADVDFSARADAALLEEGDYTSSDDERVPKQSRRTGHARSSSAMYDRSVSTKINPIPIGQEPLRPESAFRSMIRNAKRGREKSLSRARVVFRAFSLIASGAVLGAVSHTLWNYIHTKGNEGRDGKPIWSPSLSIMPTVLTLAISVYTFLTDLGFLIGSAWKNFRYLRNGTITAIIGLNSLTSCIGWILSTSFSVQQRDRPTLLWVCDVKDPSVMVDENDPNFIDFSLYCSELRFTWIASCIVAAAQGLVVVTIILGLFGNRPKKPKFEKARSGGRWSALTKGTSEWVNEKVKLFKR